MNGRFYSAKLLKISKPRKLFVHWEKKNYSSLFRIMKMGNRDFSIESKSGNLQGKHLKDVAVTDFHFCKPERFPLLFESLIVPQGLFIWVALTLLLMNFMVIFESFAHDCEATFAPQMLFFCVCSRKFIPLVAPAEQRTETIKPKYTYGNNKTKKRS